MISIRKHIERLAGEERLGKTFQSMLDSILASAQAQTLVAGGDEHA